MKYDTRHLSVGDGASELTAAMPSHRRDCANLRRLRPFIFGQAVSWSDTSVTFWNANFWAGGFFI